MKGPLLLRLAAAAIAAAAAACTSSSPTDPGADRADLRVTQSAPAQVCFSPSATANYRLRVPIEITERAGMAARIDIVRLGLFDEGGAEVEAHQATGPAVAAMLGADRVGALGALRGTVSFDFNSSQFRTVRLEFGFTDDGGRAHSQVLTSIAATAVQTCTI